MTQHEKEHSLFLWLRIKSETESPSDAQGKEYKYAVKENEDRSSCTVLRIPITFSSWSVVIHTLKHNTFVFYHSIKCAPYTNQAPAHSEVPVWSGKKCMSNPQTNNLMSNTSYNDNIHRDDEALWLQAFQLLGHYVTFALSTVQLSLAWLLDTTK